MAYLEAREERLRSLDRAIWEFYPHKRQAFRVSTGLFFLGWIAETREVYVINWYSGREGLQAFSALFHLLLLTASATKTAGRSSHRDLQPFRHHLRVAPAVSGSGPDWNGAAWDGREQWG
jgi:hypothetical protein